jgi:hypothetical protein
MLYKANAMKRSIAILGVMVVTQFIYLFFSLDSAYAEPVNPQVYPIDSSPLGVPYSEWVSKWWTWAYNLTSDFHEPAFPCDSKQVGPVWFLPDPLSGEQTRDCTIPYGKAVLIPVVTGAVTNKEKIGANDQELMKTAGDCDDDSIRTAKIDGTIVKGIDQEQPYRTNSSKVFTINVNATNQYQATPGETRIFADGWFLFLKPLPTGDHTVYVTGPITAKDPLDPNGCNGGGGYTWNLKIQ